MVFYGSNPSWRRLTFWRWRWNIFRTSRPPNSTVSRHLLLDFRRSKAELPILVSFIFTFEFIFNVLETVFGQVCFIKGNTTCIIYYSTYQKPPPGGAVILHLHPAPPTPPPPHTDSTLEAQQKYSTGYIQCMHEVHNMLLTCEWMDKTLGSRLLNHLLKSLPRSTEVRPPQATQRHDIQAVAGSARRLLDTPLRGEPSPRAGPLQNCPLGMLEMWRPWWWLLISSLLDPPLLCIL